MYLDALLADQPLTGGPRAACSGDAHLRVLTIVGFPTVTTCPGCSTNSIDWPFPIAGRPARSARQDRCRPRLLTQIRRQWFAKRKSIMAILKEVMTNEASVLLDTDAANKAIDADAALQELGLRR